MFRKTLFLQVLILALISTTATAQRTKRFISSTESTSIIKFTPTKIFRGVIEFGYEHGVGDRSSLEISAGPTLSNVSPFGNNGHGIFDQQYGLYNSTGSKLGFHTQVGFRFYPVEDKWVMNGFYVSPVISFTRHNYQFDNIYYPGESENGYRQETAFGFLFGSQQWLSKYFGIDMYAGAGLKAINYLSYYSNFDYYEPEPQWIRQADNRANWYITMGIKIAIGLDASK